MERLNVLRNLITFSQSISILADNLSKLDWDYDGPPLIVSAEQVQEVLERFLAGRFSAQELEDWANLIEGREDLEFEEIKHNEIADVIHCLANPELEGRITTDSCKALIAGFDCAND